jgi:hypothetical protein
LGGNRLKGSTLGSSSLLLLSFPFNSLLSRRFKFAKENDVVLIDEFDQTFTDILPFYALTPQTITARAERLQVDPSTFTMVIKDGHVEVLGAHALDGRAKDQLALMKRWAQYVPDVNITMSAHDGPSIMMDHGTRMKHLEHAKKGTSAFLLYLPPFRTLANPYLSSSSCGDGSG